MIQSNMPHLINNNELIDVLLTKMVQMISMALCRVIRVKNPMMNFRKLTSDDSNDESEDEYINLYSF